LKIVDLFQLGDKMNSLYVKILMKKRNSGKYSAPGVDAT